MVRTGCTLHSMPFEDWLQEQLFERRLGAALVLADRRFHLSQPTASSQARRRGSLLRADTSRNCCGSYTGIWPGAPAGPLRRSPKTFGEDVISMHGKRSTTA
jgi:hypothetical protein